MSGAVLYTQSVEATLDTSGTTAGAVITSIITNDYRSISVELVAAISADTIINVSVIDATPDSVNGSPVITLNNIMRGCGQLVLTNANFPTARSRASVLFAPPVLQANATSSPVPGIPANIIMTDPNGISVNIARSNMVGSVAYSILPTRYRIMIQNVGINDFYLTSFRVRAVM